MIRSVTPYRVAHLVPTTADGGVRRYVQQCCSMPGVQSSVVAIFASSEPSEMPLDAEVEVRLDIPLSRCRESDAINSAVAGAVRRLRPDLLHSHHFGADIFCREATAFARARKIIRHVHGILQRSSERPSAHKTVRYDWTPGEIAEEFAIEPLVHQTICVSRHIQDKLIGYGFSPAKLIVLPNSIDCSAFGSEGRVRAHARARFGVAHDDYVVGFLGRLDPCKNAITLVRLARAQKDTNTRPKYLVVGSGPTEGKLMDDIRLSGTSEMFSLYAHCADIHQFYAAIDVLIVPSLTEGFPFVILEAMASGVPVLASAVGGVPELIRHRVNGYLFNVDDLTSTLSMVAELASPTVRAKISDRARRTTSDFGVRDHQNHLMEIYSRAIAERQHA